MEMKKIAIKYSVCQSWEGIGIQIDKQYKKYKYFPNKVPLKQNPIQLNSIRPW
jgi:hypothetical protein